MVEPCEVHIRRVADGVVRVHRDGWHSDAGSPDFIWSDGNFGCDCNRHDFFEQAAGKETEGHYQCGTTAYVVDRIVLLNGEVVYADDAAR
jgi:hypothetical protein